VHFGIEKSGLKYGDKIVIQGVGGLGLNATVVAKMFGARVIEIDAVPNRLDMEKKFGADETISINQYTTLDERTEKIMTLTNGIGADVVMELSGVPAAFAEGIHLIKSGVNIFLLVIFLLAN